MPKVLIIGATGSLGQQLRAILKNQDNYEITLFSRNVDKLNLNANEYAISGSATSASDLERALKGQDFVFVALSGDLPKMATTIIDAMQKTGVQRLVFVSSMGIYGEVVGEVEGYVAPVLKPYRQVADIVEQSGLDYTILRPGWFDNGTDTECQITQKGEKFYGHDISRNAIVYLVKKMIDQPDLYSKANLGIYR